MAEEDDYCFQCGAEKKPGQSFCPKCGYSYEKRDETPPKSTKTIATPPHQYPTQYPQTPVLPAQKTDGSCIASLVLGILAWIVPFTGILAIIFGVIGIKKVDRSQGHLTGKGLGVAGLVLGIAWVIVVIGVAIAIIPVVLASNDSAQEKTCQSNMRTFLSACDIYAAENEVEPYYPSSMSQLVPEYLKEEPRCPKDNSKYIIKWTDERGSRPEISCPNHGSL